MNIYDPKRDHRFEYAAEAIEHVEQNNCVKGCVFALDATPEYPGGSCDALYDIALEVRNEYLEDTGDVIVCHKRVGP